MTTTTPSPVVDRHKATREAIIAIIVVVLVANIAATIYIAKFCTEPVPGYNDARILMIAACGVLGYAAMKLRPPKRDEE